MQAAHPLVHHAMKASCRRVGSRDSSHAIQPMSRYCLASKLSMRCLQHSARLVCRKGMRATTCGADMVVAEKHEAEDYEHAN